MKKKYLLLLAMLFINFANVGCAHSQNSGRKFSHLEKVSKKQVSKRKVPPTESVKALKTETYYSNQDNFDDEKHDEEEIASSFIADDGNYIAQYKVGNEYKVDGVEYRPQQYENFEEVGMASWYGDDFHGKKTANGETYHKGDMTAAHPTLPLPSMVLITNLDNGKSVKVRVNDRGPFSKKRVVDVSQKAAEELGFKSKGTANVKVEFLKEDTELLLKKLKIDKDH